MFTLPKGDIVTLLLYSVEIYNVEREFFRHLTHFGILVGLYFMVSTRNLLESKL